MAKKRPKDFKPEKDWPEGHKWHGKGFSRCQKWAYNQERQCERLAVKGLDCCTTHGAKSLKGAASPTFEHGRYSKYVPKALAGRIEEALTDPELLNLSDDIAVANARVTMLLEELHGAGGIESWDRLGDLYALLVSAMRTGDVATITENLNSMGEIIQDARADHRTWGRIQGAQDHKIRIVNSEHKRRIDMEMLLGRDELIMIIDRLYDIFIYSLQRHITDGSIYRSILSDASQEIRRLVSGDVGAKTGTR